MINVRSNHAVLGIPYGELSTKQYSLARTPAVPGPIEILSEIEGKNRQNNEKNGSKRVENDEKLSLI